MVDTSSCRSWTSFESAGDDSCWVGSLSLICASTLVRMKLERVTKRSDSSMKDSQRSFWAGSTRRLIWAFSAVSLLWSWPVNYFGRINSANQGLALSCLKSPEALRTVDRRSNNALSASPIPSRLPFIVRDTKSRVRTVFSAPFPDTFYLSSPSKEHPTGWCCQLSFSRIYSILPE